MTSSTGAAPRRALIVVFLLAAGAAGFAAYRLFAPGPSAADAAPAMRPHIQLRDIDGELRSISEWDGKALVVNFWATWCPPCRREIPLLIALQDEYAARGIQVIGIAIDDADAVAAYAADIGINYPLLVGEEDALAAAEAFGADIVGLPYTVFSGPDGLIRDRHAGELHREQAEEILRKLH